MITSKLCIPLDEQKVYLQYSDYARDKQFLLEQITMLQQDEQRGFWSPTKADQLAGYSHRLKIVNEIWRGKEKRLRMDARKETSGRM